MTAENNREWAGISEFQLYLFNEGTNFRTYEMLGAHKIKGGYRMRKRCAFAAVSIIGMTRTCRWKK